MSRPFKRPANRGAGCTNVGPALLSTTFWRLYPRCGRHNLHLLPVAVDAPTNSSKFSLFIIFYGLLSLCSSWSCNTTRPWHVESKSHSQQRCVCVMGWLSEASLQPGGADSATMELCYSSLPSCFSECQSKMDEIKGLKSAAGVEVWSSGAGQPFIVSGLEVIGCTCRKVKIKPYVEVVLFRVVTPGTFQQCFWPLRETIEPSVPLLLCLI